jgi:hypothetical protein
MDSADWQQKAPIITGFLLNPHSRDKFMAFFKLCFSECDHYLRYLKAKGFRMAAGSVSSGDPIQELTNSILGYYFKSTTERPFHLIFNYFHSQGITDFTAAEPQRLCSVWRGQLYKVIRQERSKILDDEDPQLALLKRRYKGILGQEPYREITDPSGGGVCIQWIEARRGLDPHLPPIPYDELLRLVEEAYYLDGTSRTKWCRKIFELLDKAGRYRNCISRHQLLSAVVAVNLRMVEIESTLPGPLLSPEYGPAVRAAEQTRARVLVRIRDNDLEKYMKQGRISEDTARRFLRAVDHYLADLACSPETLKLPEYFREVMLESEHGRYLQDYKYVFETVMNNAAACFRDQMKGFL